MPEQYTINGTITPTDGADRAGIKVRAFDRDLPSLECRTGSAAQMLGEAITDAEGRFQITYTLEQSASEKGFRNFADRESRTPISASASSSALDFVMNSN
jgi:hypothetical protein